MSRSISSWSDNAVSVTVSFDLATEGKHLETVLNMFEGHLKTVSFLPAANSAYPQMPYSAITEQEYNSYVGKLSKIDFSDIYSGLAGMALDAAGERFCTTDACELKTTPAAVEFEDEGETTNMRHS